MTRLRGGSAPPTPHVAATLPDDWDEHAVRSPGGHVMQSTAWAHIREAQGWRSQFLRIGDPLPVALVLWKRTPLGELAYVPRGPIVAAGDPASLARALDALAALARERDALVLKVDPEIDPDVARRPLRDAGFRRGEDIQPVVATLELDLSPDEDALFAGLEKDTRWSVRQAEKRGIKVIDSPTDTGLRSFYDLYALTGKRARFITRTWEYYRLVWRTLVDAGLARLTLAVEGTAVVAGAMTWRCGEREIYQYGATNDAGRRACAAYALLWRAIAAARSSGARRFDFGGIPRDLDDPRDTMHGPYLFKKGFGGSVRRWAGAHDATGRPLAYRAYTVLSPLYTRALQLTRR